MAGTYCVLLTEGAEHDVTVFMIADGRRDMQSLLARRLLGA